MTTSKCISRVDAHINKHLLPRPLLFFKYFAPVKSTLVTVNGGAFVNLVFGGGSGVLFDLPVTWRQVTH